MRCRCNVPPVATIRPTGADHYVVRLQATYSIMSIIYLHIYGLIINPHNDLLPVGLIAQLVEHCTDITGVEFASSFKPEKFRPEQGCCSAKMQWSNSFNISACLKILKTSNVGQNSSSCNVGQYINHSVLQVKHSSAWIRLSSNEFD